jgi:hypothetical protein
MICYGPTVHIYLRTKWRLFVCQYCHCTTPAEAQLWLSGIATPVSLTWFYGPRSCYSNRTEPDLIGWCDSEWWPSLWCDDGDIAITQKKAMYDSLSYTLSIRCSFSALQLKIRFCQN